MSLASSCLFFLRHGSDLSGACSSCAYPCKVRHAVSNEKKPIPSLTNRLMRAMVLFHEVVKILPLSQFTRIWHDPFRFHLLESFRIGCVFIHCDDSRSAAMWRSKRCARRSVSPLPYRAWGSRETPEYFPRESTAR
jgi:hypothetical protein